MVVMFCVLEGNTLDVTSLHSDGDGSYDDVDLSSLNVKPEYHTGRPTYTCPRCSKQFLYASQLRQHVRFHLKHRPFRCPVCLKTFVQSSNLTEHFRIHSDERPFACDFCERCFRQSSNLNYHVRTAHGQPNADQSPAAAQDSGTAAGTATGKSPSGSKQSETKSFSCEHCSRKFSHASQLSSHVRVHTNDRPFQCQFCQKMFSYSSNLAEHVRIHTGERPYICGTCNRSFAQSSQLKVHVKAHHPNSEGGGRAPLVVCPVCDVRVSGLRALREHLKLHGSGSPPKSVDPKPKPRASHKKVRPALKRSIRSRRSAGKRRGVRSSVGPCRYVCCYCDAEFASRRRLIKHLWTHEDTFPEGSHPALSSTSHLKGIRIKTEDGNESGSSTTDVEEPTDVLEDRPSTSGRLLSCLYCSKRFAHGARWLMHVKKHQKRRHRSKVSGRGSNTEKSRGRESRLKMTPAGQRVEKLDKGRTPTAVKVENGTGNDRMETSMDTWSDGDDNTEELDSLPAENLDLVPTECQQERADGDGAGGKQAAKSATTSTGRVRRPQKRGGKPSPAGSRAYPCEQCDRVMASAAALHYHRRTHSGHKPFACSVCPRRFIIRGQLVEHERIHSGEKPFACDQCPKRFAQSSQLRQHASVHSEVGIHVCPTCGESFIRPWRLLSHRRAAHAEDVGPKKRYRCEECDREYSLRQSWIYHRLTHSGDWPFQCDFCARRFRVIGQLRQHANHCRSRRLAEHQPSTDPYQQPPQHWNWYSEPAASLIPPPVSQAAPRDVPSDKSAPTEARPEIAPAEFHPL